MRIEGASECAQRDVNEGSPRSESTRQPITLGETLSTFEGNEEQRSPASLGGGAFRPSVL